MPRSIANKNYRTFVKGLITEASPLTYPENASIAEDNCVIFRKGNRTRRLGFKEEESSQISGFTFSKTDKTETYSWEAVNETGEIDLVVQRVGNFVYFYDHVSEGLGAEKLSTEIDLRLYALTPGTDLSSSLVSFASGKGYLFIVGEKMEPVSVEYVSSSSLTVREIPIQIRDFVGVDDGLANDDEPSTLSDEHHYNLRNQGWVTPNKGSTTGSSVGYNPFGTPIVTGNAGSGPIADYKSRVGVYPGNNKQWWVGKLEVDDTARTPPLTAGDFDPDVLEDTFFGNTRAPRGHFILRAFNRDRSEVSGVPNIPTETYTTRPNAVSFYSGRVWFGHESTLYYSQTLLDYRQAGNCFQEADPTSEAISDLIATDGGVIPLPEVQNIKRLYPLGGGILVFAENGLWFVGGGSKGGFSATDIAVNKLSSNGILGKETLVEADGTIYWWSPAGIMSMKQSSGLFGSQEGSFDRVNISETTIQSFYNNKISQEAKKHAKGIYDPLRNLVQWLFVGGENQDDTVQFFNRVLNLDITLQAFYPWTIESRSNTPYITGVFSRKLVKQIEAAGITTQEGTDTFNTLIKYTFAEPHSSNLFKLNFGDFSSREFSDFDHFNGGIAYTSFMETGYEILEDLMRDKHQNYAFFYFRRTDPPGNSDGTPSSCYVQTKWDWSRNESTNRWSRKYQACRVTKRNEDAAIISIKHLTRGHGRALQMRFESSETGKTFDLLGWASHYTGNTEV